jgi:hypothetical protein
MYSRWVQNSSCTHAHGYETLSIPIPGGYSYPLGNPTGRSNNTQVTHFFTFIDSTLGARTWDLDRLNLGRHVDYDQCLITGVIGGMGRPTPLTTIDQRYWGTLHPHFSING